MVVWWWCLQLARDAFGAAASLHAHACATCITICTQRVHCVVCRVVYKPAPLLAGMEAALTLELVADAPGDFVGELLVRSEGCVATLTVSAKVLPAAGGDGDGAAATVLAVKGGAAAEGAGAQQQ